MTLINLLSEANTNDLIRSYFTDKQYMYIECNVFNAGCAVFIKCTDIEKPINYGNWNGYNQYRFIDEGMLTLIAEELNRRIKNNPLKFKTPNQLKRAINIVKHEGLN